VRSLKRIWGTLRSGLEFEKGYQGVKGLIRFKMKHWRAGK
jgi:hypothetical protein